MLNLQALMMQKSVRLQARQGRACAIAPRAAAVKSPEAAAWAPTSGIAKDVTHVVGNTPMVFLKRVTKVR